MGGSCWEGGGTAGEQLRAPGRVPQAVLNVPHPCSVVVLKTHKPRLGLPAFSQKGLSFEGQSSRIRFAVWRQPRWSHRVGICISRILVARHRLHGIAGTASAGSAVSPLRLQALCGVSVHRPPGPAPPGLCTDLAVAPGTSAPPRAPVPPPQPSP